MEVAQKEARSLKLHKELEHLRNVHEEEEALRQLLAPLQLKEVTLTQRKEDERHMKKIEANIKKRQEKHDTLKKLRELEAQEREIQAQEEELKILLNMNMDREEEHKHEDHNPPLLTSATSDDDSLPSHVYMGGRFAQ